MRIETLEKISYIVLIILAVLGIIVLVATIMIIVSNAIAGQPMLESTNLEEYLKMLAVAKQGG